jgi:3-deoxy-manno-octulosonate cytidylyltransferase (CMP-KDO synthetase)
MILGIIPARYASSRFPGKPLANIKGKSMIERVFTQSKAARSLDKVIVATDDQRIYEHVLSFGGEAVYTAEHHPSGTDRCYEALQLAGSKKYHYVLNIQGDEPFISPDQIDLICDHLKDNTTELATLIIPVKDKNTLWDMGEVKVVLTKQMEALYFSRNVIPYLKGIEQNEWHLHHNYFRHVGMYAYRSDILEKITRLQPSSLEKAESLEQLRWLENGYKIKCIITQHDSHCIDTPEDIEKVIKLMNL